MTLRKRLFVLWAALSQQWHEKTCGECGAKWMAVGTSNNLIAICDPCELKEMQRFTEAMDKECHKQMWGS